MKKADIIADIIKAVRHKKLPPGEQAHFLIQFKANKQWIVAYVEDDGSWTHVSQGSWIHVSKTCRLILEALKDYEDTSERATLAADADLGSP